MRKIAIFTWIPSSSYANLFFSSMRNLVFGLKKKILINPDNAAGTRVMYPDGRRERIVSHNINNP